MQTEDSKVTNLIKSESRRSPSHFKFKEGKDESGYQSPTFRPRRSSWKHVNGGLLCRAKYGGGLVPPSRYGIPGHRGSDKARRANHPPSRYKEIKETIGNTRKVTSVLGGENVSSGTRMTLRSESRKEGTIPTPLLTPKATTWFGT